MRFRAKWQQIIRFRNLTDAEKRLLLTAATILPSTIVGMRALGFKRWYAILSWWVQRCRWDKIAGDDISSIRRTLLLMRMAVRHAPHRGNCLSQSLTLWWLLQCQGIESELRIGVRHLDNQFQAHAWIEYQGRPLNDAQDVQSRFMVFDQAIGANGTRFAHPKGSVQ